MKTVLKHFLPSCLMGVIVLLFLSNCFSGESKAKIRSAAVAGAFYPKDPKALSSMVNNFLENANPPKVSESIVGIIVPHAGYVYSGQVAAYAYKTLQGRNIKRVVVISPSHIAYFNGASIYNGDYYQTPLGLIPVDKAFARKLAEQDSRIFISDKGHIPNLQGRGEHAIEVQLPFLQTVLKKFTLVPVVMGEQSYETCRALGRALAKVIEDEQTLIVVSSDLSHYHPYQKAIELDRKVLNAIKEWDYYNLSRNFQARIWEACGGGPIVSLLIAGEYLGANQAVLLKYANSGDVPAGDRDRVVGYSAFVIAKSHSPNSEQEETFKLDQKAQRKLLQIARNAVEQVVNNGTVYEPSSGGIQSIEQDRGAFVTLKIDGQLRGCIGYTAPLKPLYLIVRDAAIQAATGDPRFSPVKPQELPHLEYEISVLSPFKHVRDVKEIQIGKHGLLIKKGRYVGLLLPQVPVEWGWDLDTYLQQICRKAGLPMNAWQDPQSDLFTFMAFVFGEHDLK